MPIVTPENYIEKRLSSRERSEAEAVRRLRSEADLLERLAVTGVTPALLARGEDEGGPWHRLERIAIPTLAERAFIDAAGVHAAFAALAAVHEAADAIGPLGVVHSDLSPSNIAIEGTRVVILDFDLASWREHAFPRDGAFRGTIRYAAPEVAAGGTPSTASDLFSLAATLAEIAIGAPLRDGNSFAALLAIAAETPVLSPAISELLVARGLDALVACLAHDPAARPPSARAIGPRR